MTIEERKNKILDKIEEMKSQGVDMKEALEYLEVEDK
jgi:hypothetical protein